MIFSVSRIHRLETLRQLHMKDDVGRIQKHILVCFTFREERVAISEHEKIKMKTFANIVIQIVRRGSTIVYLIVRQ